MAGTVGVTGIEPADLAELVGNMVVAGFVNRQELYYGLVDAFNPYDSEVSVLFIDGDRVTYNVYAFRRGEVRVIDEGSADEVAAAASALAILKERRVMGSPVRAQWRQARVAASGTASGRTLGGEGAGIAEMRKLLSLERERTRKNNDSHPSSSSSESEWGGDDDDSSVNDERDAQEDLEEREFALFFDGEPRREIFSHLEDTASWSDIVGGKVHQRAVRSPRTPLGQLRVLCNDIDRRFQSRGAVRAKESTKQIHKKAQALGASTLDGLQGFAVFLNDKCMQDFLETLCTIAEEESSPRPFASLSAQLCEEALRFVTDEFGGDSGAAAAAAGVEGAQALDAVAPEIVAVAQDRFGTPTVNAGHHTREFAPQCIFTIVDAGRSGLDVGAVVSAADKDVLHALQGQGVRLAQTLVPELLGPTQQPALQSYLRGAFEQAAKVSACPILRDGVLATPPPHTHTHTHTRTRTPPASHSFLQLSVPFRGPAL